MGRHWETGSRGRKSGDFVVDLLISSCPWPQRPPPPNATSPSVSVVPDALHSRCWQPPSKTSILVFTGTHFMQRERGVVPSQIRGGKFRRGKFCGNPWICVRNLAANLKPKISHGKSTAPEPLLPPCLYPRTTAHAVNFLHAYCETCGHFRRSDVDWDVVICTGVRTRVQAPCRASGLL